MAFVSRRKVLFASKEMRTDYSTNDPAGDEPYQKMVRPTSMEMRVERLEGSDSKYNYNGYSVVLGEHRVLTLSSGCSIMVTKWLRKVLKTANTKSGKLVVGISLDEPRERWRSKEKMMQICAGSHCLIIRLPAKEELPYGWCGNRITPALNMLKEFFGNRKVFAVVAADDEASGGGSSSSGGGGTKKMQLVVKDLNEEYDIKICNPVQVVSAAKLAEKAKEIGIGEKYWPISASKAPWYEDRWYYNNSLGRWAPVPWPIQFTDDELLTDNKVLFSALKTYLCFSIANDNLSIK
ncbi:hypothetical protein LguiB_003841 [Lonicera macranthoides]